jgi:hypothetical protein
MIRFENASPQHLWLSLSPRAFSFQFLLSNARACLPTLKFIWPSHLVAIHKQQDFPKLYGYCALTPHSPVWAKFLDFQVVPATSSLTVLAPLSRRSLGLVVTLNYSSPPTEFDSRFLLSLIIRWASDFYADAELASLIIPLSSFVLITFLLLLSRFQLPLLHFLP